MADEVKKETEVEKEVTPTWATKLQESLDNLSSSLSEMFPQPQQETDPSEPQEIPLPQPPQQEEPPQPQEVVTETEQPKRRKFLDWLM